jgi:hypothetical protein
VTTGAHHGQPISLELAREAKGIVRGSKQLMGYAHGIGIGRDDRDYYVKVNLDNYLPESISATFPKTVTTSAGNVVRVVYRVTGPIAVADYA